eukprot:GHVQ01023734.1.p1 GENE.GHVQ01023734.1~~GHVQ01023734.1.p1  ORF type:complete len:483 (+),score=25.71 GHVQ01023734.1:1-1449(+)
MVLMNEWALHGIAHRVVYRESLMHGIAHSIRKNDISLYGRTAASTKFMTANRNEDPFLNSVTSRRSSRKGSSQHTRNSSFYQLSDATDLCAVASLELREMDLFALNSKPIVQGLGRGSYGVVVTIASASVPAHEALKFYFNKRGQDQEIAALCVLFNAAKAIGCASFAQIVSDYRFAVPIGMVTVDKHPGLRDLMSAYRYPPTAELSGTALGFEKYDADLFNYSRYIRSFPLNVRNSMRVQITTGLIKQLYHFHHSFKLLHADIKPGNVLVRIDGTYSTVEAALGDFGLARKLATTEGKRSDELLGETFRCEPSNAVCRTPLGTVPYMPPEVFDDIGKHGSYTYSSKWDVYSLGVTLSELWTDGIGQTLCSDSIYYSPRPRESLNPFFLNVSTAVQEVSTTDSRFCVSGADGNPLKTVPARNKNVDSKYRMPKAFTRALAQWEALTAGSYPHKKPIYQVLRWAGIIPQVWQPGMPEVCVLGC